jgi:hypothetical protein
MATTTTSAASARAVGATAEAPAPIRPAAVRAWSASRPVRTIECPAAAHAAPSVVDRDAAIYELSDLGSSLAPGPLLQLARWAEQNQAELAATS